MKVFFGFKQLKKFRKPVVALGVFDGVHRAHRRILEETVRQAKRIQGTSVAVTFWPHPQRENSICSLEHRLRLISGLGIGVCIVIRFNKAFSKILAEDFIKDILVNKIGAHYIFVGKNFRFGKGAAGDFRLLDRLSRVYNFKLKLFAVLKIDNLPISSSYIRRLIMQGELKTASRLLYRPVSILGTVIKGSFLARKLGFPTANINPHHEVIPPSGIYAARIVLNKKKFFGICYIGTNPTLKLQKSIHTEAHIFNFKQNIYGKDLEIQFIQKLRDEKRFASTFSLVQQVKKDILQAKSILSLP